MMQIPNSPFLRQLRGRITLDRIPFAERDSRLLVFREQAHLFVRVEERWIKWRHQVGEFSKRAPILDDFLFADENGVPLDFHVTTFPHALYFETRVGEFALTFADVDTLFLSLPSARCRIVFRVYATAGETDRRGGVFRCDPQHQVTHRNVAYTTNARILSNIITPDQRGYLRVQLQLEATANAGLVLNITHRFDLNRRVPPPEATLQKAEQRWHTWFAAAPPVNAQYAAQYYYAWWILCAGLIGPRGHLTREAMSPSMVHYVGVWAWDAYFHAIAYRHVDRELAENQLRILLDYQRADGMLPDAIHDEGVVTQWKMPNSVQEVDVTKPPLMAWAAMKLYEASGERDFLDEVYEPLVRWNHWWFEKNDDDHDGIVQYNHPNSSGLDDSPLWDEGMPVESPDLNTYLVMQMDALAKIADLIGLPDDAAQWRAQADALTQRIIAHFWDTHAGVFWATREHKPIRVLTPFNLFPLLTGRLPGAMVQRLLAHLQAKEEFGVSYPIPTVARSDEKHDPAQMWRGPTWVNINYLFVEGLARCGYPDLARQLLDKTLKLVMRHDDIYEYYNPDTGDPSPHSASVFGWSSALFVDLAIKASHGEISQDAFGEAAGR